MARTRGERTVPDLLLVREVASRLRVTDQFITGLLRRGEIRCYRIGRLWRIDRADLEAWLQKRRPCPHRLPIGSWAEKWKSVSLPRGGSKTDLALKTERERISQIRKRERGA